MYFYTSLFQIAGKYFLLNFTMTRIMASPFSGLMEAVKTLTLSILLNYQA